MEKIEELHISLTQKEKETIRILLKEGIMSYRSLAKNALAGAKICPKCGALYTTPKMTLPCDKEEYEHILDKLGLKHGKTTIQQKPV